MNTPHRFDWTAGYPSRRSPLFARNIVSTSHPLAAQAGLRVMQAGGNAVDAAIAAAACMTLVEPCSNGLGSDAFCILWDGQQLHGLNASGPAPAAWTPAFFQGQVMPRRGWGAVTVPGAVGGWMALSERFGRLPFADLMQPAIEIAERGYAVPPIVQGKWAMAAALDEITSQPGFAQAFLPHGRAPEVGERFTFADAARSLRLIAQTKGEAFYRGEIAAALARFARETGGALTEADLAAYRPEWVTPLAKDFAGHTLHEIPPNGQGIAAQMALGLLSHCRVTDHAVDSPEAQHLMIEAMKLAFADVYRFVAEPAAMKVSPAQLLDDGYLAERARLIDPARAQVFGAGNPIKGGTIYLTAADERGMMVSFIQSNYMGFGSGLVLPGYGVSLQNRGHCFTLEPGHPNQVAPGKRPFHTIIPAFLTAPMSPAAPSAPPWGGPAEAPTTRTPAVVPVMSFGVMGGNMQPQGHMQTLVRMLCYGQNPQAACDAPRWRFNEGLSINIEPHMPAATIESLRARGHDIGDIHDSYQDFGAGQFIWRQGDPAVDGYVAASDPRRDGAAVGW
ncbi:MAG: gamma-glutamyltransferase family protein [Methylotenera sp.]|jgi:gamma-glutamyltranspeptidase / glutathione hydrolase|nr:gamma-glutamyltransferase family protein [Methylotenera sp.]